MYTALPLPHYMLCVGGGGGGERKGRLRLIYERQMTTIPVPLRHNYSLHLIQTVCNL